MTIPTGPGADLASTIRRWLDDKAVVRSCPLCKQQAWDFQGARVVFLVEAERVCLEKIQDHLERTGSTLYREHPGQALIRELFKVFEEATRDNRLVRLSCNNCGHTELLDARKLNA